MANMNTGTDLKAWRKENHLTQKELAGRVSYSTSRISHIEYGNEPLTIKLKKQILKLDMLLNPQPKKDPISEKWDSIAYYSNIYGEEMDVIEEGILSLLTINVKKMGLDNTEAYLKFIGSALLSLSEVTTIPFSDTEEGRELALQLFNRMYREALIYLKKIHSS